MEEGKKEQKGLRHFIKKWLFRTMILTVLAGGLWIGIAVARVEKPQIGVKNIVLTGDEDSMVANLIVSRLNASGIKYGDPNGITLRGKVFQIPDESGGLNTIRIILGGRMTYPSVEIATAREAFVDEFPRMDWSKLTDLDLADKAAEKVVRDYSEQVVKAQEKQAVKSLLAGFLPKPPGVREDAWQATKEPEHPSPSRKKK